MDDRELKKTEYESSVEAESVFMTESEDKRWRKTKKTISGVVAITLALAMMVTGTYAFTHGPALLASELEETEARYKIVGHDDFVQQSGSSYNKDVYVENLGAGESYVRVKLEEVFVLNGELLCGKTDAHGEDGYGGTPHIPAANDAAQGTGEDTKAHQYFHWEMGRDTGADPLYFLSAAAKDSAAGTNFYYAADPEHAQEANQVFIEDYIARNNSGYRYRAADAADAAKAVKAIPSCSVITMAQYMEYRDQAEAAAGETSIQDFTGWVVDTDGWCYWSKPLNDGETTGLLLDAVNISPQPPHGYTYRIDVTFQAINDADTEIWLQPNINESTDGVPVVGDQESTEDGKTLLHILQGDSKKAAEHRAKGDMSASAGVRSLYYQAADALMDGRTHTYTSDEPYAGVYETRLAQAEKANTEVLNAGVNTEEMDLSRIDASIRKYILEKYGKGGKLTVDQALAVTEVRITNATTQGQVQTLKGMTKQVATTTENQYRPLFPNLDVLQCRYSEISAAEWHGLQYNLNELYYLGQQLKVLDLRYGNKLSADISFGYFPGLLVLNLDSCNFTNFSWDNYPRSLIACSMICVCNGNRTFTADGNWFPHYVEYINFKGSNVAFSAVNGLQKMKYFDMDSAAGLHNSSSETEAVALNVSALSDLAYLNCWNLSNHVTSVNVAPTAFSKVYTLADIAGGWGVDVLEFELADSAVAAKPCIVDTGCTVRNSNGVVLGGDKVVQKNRIKTW